MGFLDDLGSILGAPGTSGQNRSPSHMGGLKDILGPGVLGGLIGAILPGKRGVLATGGAAALAALLWNKYKDRIMPPAGAGAQAQAPASASPAAVGSGSLPPATVRLIRAMVFAAKSDGRLDEGEKAAINDRLQQLQAGPEAAQLVAQAMNEPLDPQLVAEGVTDPQEAMALFLASCAVIKVDQFMESAYLNALAKALGLPPEMLNDIEAQAQAGQGGPLSE